MWLLNQPIEVLREALRYSSVPTLFSGPNGEIYWVNEAFSDLLEYTSFELFKKGWIDISVKGDDLEADFAMTQEVVNGNRASFKLTKSFVSKSGNPIAGELSAVRFPHDSKGATHFFICTFVPLLNSNKAALNLMTSYIEKHCKMMESLTNKIDKIVTQDEDEVFIVNTVKAMKRHPKVAAGILIIMASLLGLNQVVELAKNIGLYQ